MVGIQSIIHGTSNSIATPRGMLKAEFLVDFNANCVSLGKLPCFPEPWSPQLRRVKEPDHEDEMKQHIRLI